MRSIRVELLRPGSDHNQLLSPAIPYVALCGEQAAETVRLSFEHRHAIQWLKGLSRLDSQTTQPAFREALESLSRALLPIRGVISELTSAADSTEDALHLQLVLSASELAMLPWEILTDTGDHSGADPTLLLRPRVPLTITRCVRQSANTSWPHWKPRFLVARGCAEHSERALTLPLRHHLLALRRALGPFMVRPCVQELARFVTVLPHASAEQIHQAIEHADPPYSHVHILAHGRVQSEVSGAFELELRSDADPSATVWISGQQLTAALHARTPRRPFAVVLASCRSSATPEVYTPGGSMAHALHEAGIPQVFASQFPLTASGSVVATEVLYRELLAGEDPRRALVLARRQLRVSCGETFDWASLLGYVSQPAQFEHELARSRAHLGRMRVETAMRRLDRALFAPGDDQEHLQALMTEMERLRRDVVDGVRTSEFPRWGLLARAYKQVAGVWHARGDEKHARDALRQAQQFYDRAFRGRGRPTWALVQSLAIQAFLGPPLFDPAETSRRWTAAVTLARDDVEHAASPGESRRARVWGLAALVELDLLALALPSRPDASEHPRASLAALLREEPAVGGEAEWEADIKALIRQVGCYARWWWRDREAVCTAANGVLSQIGQALPLLFSEEMDAVLGRIGPAK